MAQASPIGFKEVLQLTQLGVDANNIRFKSVALQSEKYIVVNQGKSVSIIECATKKLLSLPVTVDSAIMNPVSRVIALRSKAGDKTNLQIYNLEMKTKMKATTIPGSVDYWKWVDPKTIAIVTPTTVFHWIMDGNAQPKKAFERAANKNGPVQIINYRVSDDRKWLMLGGIQAGGPLSLTGVLQVYSTDLKVSQPSMDAHAACFASIVLDGKSTPSTLFCFTKIGAEGKLNIIEVGVPKAQAFMKSTNLPLAKGDFPVAMLPDKKFGMIFILSKQGVLFMFDIQSGLCIFSEKASQATMFASIECNDEDGGILAVDQGGRVSRFFVDKSQIVEYITNKLNNFTVATSIAARCNLGGGSGLFAKQFDTLLQQGNTDAAMKLAASSPQGALRTLDTINAFRHINNGQAVLQYFQLLLKQGDLNAIESVELVKPILQKGSPQGLEHVKNWIQEKKLTSTEELGDLLKNTNIKFALAVYLKANVHDKVISCFLSLGAQEADDAAALEHLKNVLNYAKQVSFTPDYPVLLQQLIRVRLDRAKDFAILLLQSPEGAKIEIQPTIGMFMQQGDVKNTTNILLEYLRPRGDLEEDGMLQTKLLEINLLGNKPAVADAILESEDYSFSHYDKLKIAQLCERVNLLQRALEHYTDLMDIKRVLHNAQALDPQFLMEFFGRMTPEDCLDCLRDLLKNGLQKNIRLVVEVAQKWSDHLTPTALIQLFEEVDSNQGLYFYLGSFVNFTEDTDVVFKYIQAACKLGQLKEVERVARDNEHYEPKEVKEFLLSQNLKDPRPLIHVCDRFGYIEELTQYLYQNQMHQFIEAYVQRMNPKAAPPVIAALLDLNANEDMIRGIISAVRPPANSTEFIGDLCKAVEERNRLKILRTWLEERMAEGNTDPQLHNGLAKIYVDINNNPQSFLTTNKFYNSQEVGKYCENRDPHLAFIAYKRAWGECDNELVAVTSKNGFFKDQARYLVERQDLTLWARVLTDDNEFKGQLIDQVVATALPESRIPEEISTTVKAFMAANLPTELIELLERIILHGPQDGEFANNKNLQNLLILTAIKADKKRVMDYIKRLDNYDGPDIAKIAVSDQYELYEEAFFIYKKFEQGEEALKVLLDHLGDIQRSTEFAEYWDKPDVWSLLAKAQLDGKLVKEAISSFLKANDAAQFSLVINAAKQDGHYNELITFLQMARSKIKDPELDNNLIYCLAKTDRLADLEDFIVGSNVAKIQDIGEMLFNEEMYLPAKLLFNHINNSAKLAICLVKLEQFQEAVDAARKANAMPTWKAVCFSCVDARKFRLAQMCALHIIVYMDHLSELIVHYEQLGYFSELIDVMEQGINLDRAHQGIYTQLGVLYCKYKEEKLMEHIKLFWSRLVIPSLLVECQRNQHWAECVFLYTHYDQFDNAVDVLINHSEAWEKKLFKEIIVQVSKTEVYYRAIDFYLREHPLDLVDLLLDLVNNLDHSRVVHIISQAGHLPLIAKYLQHIQRENVSSVNEALNSLYVEEEDYKSLRESVDSYVSFDQIALAQQLEKHQLVEFRRIAAYIFLMNKKYEKSINLAKQDELWTDAMDVCAASQDAKLAESLLRFFVEHDNKSAFTACLYTCYHLIQPDVVLELAWRFDLMSFAMPFMIQTFRGYDNKLTAVTNRMEKMEEASAEKEEQEQKKQQDQDPGGYNMGNHLALAPPPQMGGMGGFQQQQQQQQQYGGVQNTNAFFN